MAAQSGAAPTLVLPPWFGALLFDPARKPTARGCEEPAASERSGGLGPAALAAPDPGLRHEPPRGA